MQFITEIYKFLIKFTNFFNFELKKVSTQIVSYFELR